LRSMFLRVGPSPSAIYGVGRSLDVFASRQTERSIRAAAPDFQIPRVGLDAPRDMLEEWVAENVALIKSIDDRYFDDLARVIREDMARGALTPDLAGKLEQRYNVSKARARLIARDQCGKLNGDLTAYKQQRVGIRRYRWSTSRDERVRPEHVALNGKIREWSDPHPTEGHPGHAIQCRCTATPILDWVDAAPQPRKRVGYEPPTR
jgi:SPP1 gp7 family putative phage head morphogenesis protein